MEIFFRTVLIGLIDGSIFALAAVGLVLTYKVSGILNFGFGAVALFTTFVYWQFAVAWGWPVWLSALLVLLVVAPAIGVFLDTRLFSMIQGQPMAIGVIATVGLTVLLQGTVFMIWGAQSRSVPSLFPSGTFRLPGGVHIGADDVAILLVAASAMGLLAFMFRFTRLGVAFRAVVDNRPVAGLMAINAAFVSSLAWAMGTAFAALTGLLLTPKLLLDPLILPFFVVAWVIGAAMVGYLRSLPLAFAGGLLLGVLKALVVQYTSFSGLGRNLPEAIPFIIVLLMVLFAPKALRVVGLTARFIVQKGATHRSVPPNVTVAAGVAVFAGLALVPFIAGDAISWILALVRGMSMGLIFLSIVILTGFSGQLSLGHTAFMGISAFTAAHLMANFGMPPLLAIIFGTLAAVPAGALIGIVAVRLHGLFLALMTLGAAFVAHVLFFSDASVSGGFAGMALPRPGFASGDRAFYYFVWIFFAAATLLALNLRSGRTGRTLAAMRDSETASRSLGINVFKYKVAIFSLSAGMAGLGAIMHGMLVERIGPNDFIPLLALFLVTLTVAAGIFHIGGAITAAVLFGLFHQVIGRFAIPGLEFVLFGLGSTLALGVSPEGLFGLLRRGASFAYWTIRGGPAQPAGVEPAAVAGGQR